MKDLLKMLKKEDLPDETENLEEGLNNYVSEKDLKSLKTELPDKRFLVF